VLSADGKWRAQARELPRAPAAEVTGTDFEKRHASRFKGRTFDWMRFQSDGQDYPTPDPRARPAAEIAVTAVDGGQPKTITALGMRAANVTWHPSGDTIAFTADGHVAERAAYEQPDIYTVTRAAT
jgi:Tol biopolymer transport system component